jgi:hypothetical protein
VVQRRWTFEEEEWSISNAVFWGRLDSLADRSHALLSLEDGACGAYGAEPMP